MKMLATTLIVLGIAILSSSSNSVGQAIPYYEEYLSGPVPSVSINSDVTLVPNKATPLTALVTFNPVPTDSQCTFVQGDGGPVVGTGTCNWANAVIFVNPGSGYTLNGRYVYPQDRSTPGVHAGVLFGSGGNVVQDVSTLGDYSQITVTANANASGSIFLSGSVGPATVNTPPFYFLTGGSNWGGLLQVGPGLTCAAYMQKVSNVPVEQTVFPGVGSITITLPLTLWVDQRPAGGKLV